MDRGLAIWIAVSIFLGCAMVSAQTPSIMTPRAFTERFAQELGAAVPTATIMVRQDLRLTARLADRKTLDLDLSNVYGEYKGQPERFGDLVAVFARAAKNPVPPPINQAHVIPMMKPRAWLDDMAPINRKYGYETLFDPFAGDLIIAYVEDFETRSRYLASHEDVGDRRTLRARAVFNLKQLLPKILMKMPDDDVAVMTAGGNYEPSLLLVDEIWWSGQIRVDGEIVVAVPARDSLLITGSNSRAGLASIRAMVAKLAEGPYPLSRKLFVYRNGRFVEFAES